MKKKGIKKLQLSRETLRDLASPDARKVLGGIGFTPQTGQGCCPLTEEHSACCNR